MREGNYRTCRLAYANLAHACNRKLARSERRSRHGKIWHSRSNFAYRAIYMPLEGLDRLDTVPGCGYCGLDILGRGHANAGLMHSHAGTEERISIVLTNDPIIRGMRTVWCGKRTFMNAYPGRVGLLATLCIVFSVSVFTHTAPSAPLAPPVETSSGGDDVIGEESFRAFHFFLVHLIRPDQKSYPCSPGRQFSRANSDQSMEQATTRSIRFWVQPTPHF